MYIHIYTYTIIIVHLKSQEQTTNNTFLKAFYPYICIYIFLIAITLICITSSKTPCVLLLVY